MSLYIHHLLLLIARKDAGIPFPMRTEMPWWADISHDSGVFPTNVGNKTHYQTKKDEKNKNKNKTDAAIQNQPPATSSDMRTCVSSLLIILILGFRG